MGAEHQSQSFPPTWIGTRNYRVNVKRKKVEWVKDIQVKYGYEEVISKRIERIGWFGGEGEMLG